MCQRTHAYTCTVVSSNCPPLDWNLRSAPAKKNSQGSQYDWFQPIIICTCHVRVQRCISEHLKSNQNIRTSDVYQNTSGRKRSRVCWGFHSLGKIFSRKLHVLVGPLHSWLSSVLHNDTNFITTASAVFFFLPSSVNQLTINYSKFNASFFHGLLVWS